MSEDRTAVLVRLPRDLKRRLQGQARRQGVSLNQMINYSLAREVTLMEAQTYLEKRLDGKPAEEIQKRFWEVMEKVQDRPVPDWDRI